MATGTRVEIQPSSVAIEDDGTHVRYNVVVVDPVAGTANVIARGQVTKVPLTAALQAELDGVLRSVGEYMSALVGLGDESSLEKLAEDGTRTQHVDDEEEL